MGVSTETLTKIAIALAPIGLGGALIFKRKTENNFQSQEFFRKSFELLNGYEPGIQIIGKPYKIRQVNLGDKSRNYTDGFNAGMNIELKGARKTCYLISKCSREKLEDIWEVDKLDLDCDSQRWTFYINPKKRDSIRPFDSFEKISTNEDKISEKVGEDEGCELCEAVSGKKTDSDSSAKITESKSSEKKTYEYL